MTHSTPKSDTFTQKATASETARWALLDGKEALDAVALGGELGQFYQLGGVSSVDAQTDELRVAFVKATRQGGVPATAIQRERVNTEEKAPADLFWASFVADRKTGFILAAVGLNYEESGPHKQQRVGFSPVSFYFFTAGGPFQSLFRVVHNGPAHAAFSELHFQSSNSHGDRGDFSLSFALAAWEAENIRRSLQEASDDPAGGAQKINRKQSLRV